MKHALEAEVSECTVGLGHFVHVFFSFECTALFVESVDDFGSEFVGHSLTATFAGIKDKIFH